MSTEIIKRKGCGIDLQQPNLLIPPRSNPSIQPFPRSAVATVEGKESRVLGTPPGATLRRA